MTLLKIMLKNHRGPRVVNATRFVESAIIARTKKIERPIDEWEFLRGCRAKWPHIRVIMFKKKNDHSMFTNLWTHSCTSYLTRVDVSLIINEYDHDAALWTIVQYRIKYTLRSWIEVMKRQQRRESIIIFFFCLFLNQIVLWLRS